MTEQKDGTQLTSVLVLDTNKRAIFPVDAAEVELALVVAKNNTEIVVLGPDLVTTTKTT